MLKILSKLPILVAAFILFAVITPANFWTILNPVQPLSVASAFSVPASLLLMVAVLFYVIKGKWKHSLVTFALISSVLISVSGFTTAANVKESNFKALTVNVLWNNTDGYSKITESIKKLNPDVVFLQEYNLDHDRGGLLNLYPYQADGNEGNGQISNSVILSKYPFVSTETVQFYAEKIPTAKIIVNNKTVNLISVHTLSPTTLDRSKGWVSDLNTLQNWAKSQNGSIIMAGDFNANGGMQPFRAFVYNAKLSLTNRFMPTWGFIDGLKTMQIDHILLSNDVKLKDFKVLEAIGSDHSLNYAELQIG